MTGRFGRLRVPLDTPPMEARLVGEIPEGAGWQFEPKWDGFRCLAFRDRGEVELMSKSGKPLGRYFPEVVARLAALGQDRFVVDGELIVPAGATLSFAALQARLHPAASRIARLSAETPAQVILFDALEIGGALLRDEPLEQRRGALEDFVAAADAPDLLLSPMTVERDTAQAWLARSGGALDGIVAKRRDEPYRAGERAMFKRKLRRTADCVVGGFRYDASGTKVASLLLGLYDEAGKLGLVGFVAGFTEATRVELAARLEPLRGPSAFTGAAPGGPSRWSHGKSTEWVALRPERVVEVAYDQVTGQRMRHGASFVRWRADKAPRQCRLDQLEAELRPEELARLLARTES
ncbi:MAG TPA: ATP-dependent DNA ligase [Novosphingobium sp.]|nr:ATP-dependent DNA ligase [Novosphingobium sp.]